MEVNPFGFLRIRLRPKAVCRGKMLGALDFGQQWPKSATRQGVAVATPGWRCELRGSYINGNVRVNRTTSVARSGGGDRGLKLTRKRPAENAEAN